MHNYTIPIRDGIRRAIAAVRPRRQQKYSADGLGGGTLSTEAVQQIVQAIQATAEFEWVRLRMQASAGEGDGLDGPADGGASDAAEKYNTAPVGHPPAADQYSRGRQYVRGRDGGPADDRAPFDEDAMLRSVASELGPNCESAKILHAKGKTAGDRYADLLANGLGPDRAPVAQASRVMTSGPHAGEPSQVVQTMDPNRDAPEGSVEKDGYGTHDQAVHKLAMDIAQACPGKPYTKCLDEARAELGKSAATKSSEKEKFSRDLRRERLAERVKRGSIKLNDFESGKVRALAIKHGLGYSEAKVRYLMKDEGFGE